MWDTPVRIATAWRTVKIAFFVCSGLSLDMPDDPLLPLPTFQETFRPAPLADVEAALTAALLAGGAGGLSRAADTYLAGACAHVLAERLALAGLVVCRVRS